MPDPLPPIGAPVPQPKADDLPPVGGAVSQPKEDAPQADPFLAELNTVSAHGGPAGTQAQPSMLELGVEGVKGLASNLNPVPVLKSLYESTQSPLGQTLGPVGAEIDFGGKILRGQIDTVKSGIDALKAGNTGQGIQHVLAGLVPILGPSADDALNDIESDDPRVQARGFGKAVGILAPLGAGKFSKLAKMVPEAVRAPLADALQSSANERFAGAVSEGAGKAQGVKVANVAEQALNHPDVTGITKSGVRSGVQAELEKFEDALDTAAANRPSYIRYKTQPLINGLQAKIDALTVRGANGQPIVPPDVMPRVAKIQEAIDTLKKLGGSANYDAIKGIRQGYDIPARATYAPTMEGYTRLTQEAKGAADVTGTLREGLAQMSPSTAEANAGYHLFKTLDDAMQAATDNARPRVSRAGPMLKGAATAVGEASGGWKGAVKAYLASSAVEAAAKAAPSMQIALAKMMTRAANALRANQPAVAQSAMMQFASATKTLPLWRAAVQGGSMTPAAADQSTTPVPVELGQ